LNNYLTEEAINKSDTRDDSLILEYKGINIKNEKSLHNDIKRWYSQEGDRFEVKVDGSIIDIVRDDLLIEVQTKNFSAIKNKLVRLCKKHKLRLIYPIAVEKWITTLEKDNTNVISRRKSPKKGRVEDVFEELLRMPALINEENFQLVVLMIKVEEIRCADGQGSWRRKGISIVDRKLLDVVDIFHFQSKEDFFTLLPENLTYPFTNKSLGEVLKISPKKVTKITYTLKHMGLIKEVGKSGRQLLFDLNS